MNYRDTMKINAAGHLEIGGCDCVELARQYGTPLYVMDEEYIRSVCRAFKQTIEKTYGSGNMAYASKAFSCKAIYNVMKQEKTFIDVVSGGEIYTAASVGFDMSGAFFHGNNKTDGELELAMRTGVGTIVIDAADDAERIDALARRFEKVQNVLVRVNPGVEAHTHSYIQTAKVDSKFGFSVSSGAATAAIKDVLSRKSLHFAGLHCHIGSQIFDRSAFALAVFEELRDEQAAFRLEDLRSRGNGQEHVRAVAPVAVASRAGLAVFGVPVRLKGVAAQVALVFVADEHDVAAVPAVAAVGSALGQEFFAAEAQAAVPAVAGAQVNFRFVDEHFSERKKGAEGKRFGVIGRRRRALCRDPFF